MHATADLKIWEYYNQVLSQRQIYTYSREEFKRGVEPLLESLGQSSNHFIEHALEFFLSLDYAPYDSEWLEKWFHRLSANLRPIPYYYPGQFPGETAPTVRIVNQLDLLELIVVDADFSQ
jgi:hypothetical protein